MIKIRAPVAGTVYGKAMRGLVIALLILVCSQPCLAQLTPEQELFIKAGKMTREQQRENTVQRGLRNVVKQAIDLYCHSLDDLACRELFSLGDPNLFRSALVNVDGVNVDRNVIYVEGRGNPQHLDNGPYILPVNFWLTYLPLSPNSNTLWHEAQHELLVQAGMAGALYTQASHHNLMEGISERGAEAFAKLRPFEKELRKAAAETQGKKLTVEQERAHWGTAQALWRNFAREAQRIRRTGSAGTTVERYKEITGIFFRTTPEVQAWYQDGKLTLSDGTPVRPPAWIFEMPGYLPADIDVIASPPVVKGTSYECSVGVTVKANLQTVTQGKLRIKLESEDYLGGLRVSQDKVGSVPGLAGPGGPSTRLFEVDLSKGQPVTVTFVHLRTDKLQSTEYPITLSYADPGANRKFSDTEREYVFKPAAQGTLKLDIQGGRTVDPGKPLKLTAVLAGDQTGLHEIFWYDETRDQVLGSGQSISFQADDPGTYTVNVKARVRREGTIATGAETRVPIEVRRATTPPPTPPDSGLLDKPVVHLSSNDIMASDFFSMWVELPTWMAAKATEYYWSVGALTQGPKADLQLESSDVGQPLGVSIRDARGDELGKAYAAPGSYQTRAAQFSFQLPASWKFSKTERGNVLLSRGPSLEVEEKAAREGAQARIWGSAGGGGVTVAWLSAEDMREINGGQPGPREWKSEGDPRSRLIRTKGGMGYEVTIRRESYLMDDGDSKLRDALRAKWQPQMEAHRDRFDREVEAFLASLTVTPEGTITRVPDLPVPEVAAPLTVRIEGARASYRAGEESAIRAVVENAGPKDAPLKYEWSGPVVGQGDQVKLVAPSHADKGTVGVTVRGASGASAVAQVEFAVSTATVSLSMQPAGPKFPVGSTVTLSAQANAAGSLTYLFEPADQLEFESNKSSASSTRVRLRKPGTFQVWVKIADGKGAILAESQPLSLEVVSAELPITLSPSGARVGQTVTASVTADPAAQMVWELPAHFQQTGGSGARIEFRALEPTAGEVRVKALSGNLELGRGSAAFNPQGYQLRLQVVSGELRSGSPVKVAASLDAAPSGSVTYRWSAQPGLSLVGGSGGQEITVKADQAGAFRLSVEAGDAAAGVTYARAEQTLEFSSGAARAGSLMEEARKAAESGRFEQAVELANKAASMDAASTAAARSELANSLSDLGWKAALQDDYATAKAALGAAVTLAPQDLKIGKRAQDVKKAEAVWPRVQELGARCHKLIDEQKMISAYPVFSEVVRLGNDLVYERMDQHPFVQAVGKHWAERQDAFNRFYQEAEMRVGQLSRTPDGYQEILSLADAMESWELTPATARQVAGWRADALAVRDKALALWVDVTPLQHETPVGGQFQMVATVKGGTPPYRYEWKLAGQSTGVSTPSHVWKIEQAGSYSLQVLVWDSRGQTASAESRVTVIAPVRAPLRARVEPARYQASPGVAFQTVAQAEGGAPPYRYEWLVGTERSGVLNQVNVWTLNQPGVYPIRVLVTDAEGHQAYGDCTATLGATPPATPPTGTSPPTVTPPPTAGSRITGGTTSAGTSYPANCHGDPFTGGDWCNARNGSDWLQRDFGDLYRIDELRIGKAGTDVTTDNSSIVIKVLNEQGQWQVVEELRNTNINMAQLTGGARANSLPSYRRAFSPPLRGRALRIELAGHGWFGVSDVAVIGKRLGMPSATIPTTTAPPQPPKPPTTTTRPPTTTTKPPTTVTKPPSGGSTVLAVLENASGENIHLFGPGESFDPANRLTPGQTRKVSLRLPADGRIEFIAGRSGQVLQRKTWSGDPSDPSRFPRVRWTDQGLVITTGLR